MHEKDIACEEQAETSRKPASLYLAPSSNGDGWGVFSSRCIEKGDIVELAPLLLRFPEEEPEVLKGTILNNYHYQYWAWNGVTTESQLVLSFGYMLYFNHSSQPNIKYQQFGREPDIDNPGHAVALGYYALYDIPAHEELLCDYGGQEWFRDRGVTLVDAPNEEPARLHKKTMQATSDDWMLRSMLHSGYGKSALQKVLESHVDGECEIPPYNMDTMHSRLFLSGTQSTMTGFGNVLFIEDVQEGATLEVVPVLVLLKSAVVGSLLETIIVEWRDLDFAYDLTTKEHVEVVSMSDGDEGDQSVVQVRSVTKTVPMQDTVLLALAGNLSLVWRHMSEYNTRLVVEHDPCNKSAFLLRLIATKSIRSGERVVVRLPSLASPAIERLVEELALTGQPIVSDLISQ